LARGRRYPFDRFLGFELKLKEHGGDQNFADALTPILVAIVEAVSRELSDKSAIRTAVVTAH